MKNAFLSLTLMVVALAFAGFAPAYQRYNAERAEKQVDLLLSAWENSSSCKTEYQPLLKSVLADLEMHQNDYKIEIFPKAGFSLFREASEGKTVIHIIDMERGANPVYSSLEVSRTYVKFSGESFHMLPGRMQEYMKNKLKESLATSKHCSRDESKFQELVNFFETHDLQDAFVLKNECVLDLSRQSSSNGDDCDWITEKYETSDNVFL